MSQRRTSNKLHSLAHYLTAPLVIIPISIALGFSFLTSSAARPSQSSTGPIKAELILTKDEYRGREAIVATVRLRNVTTRPIEFHIDPHVPVEEYAFDGKAIPNPEPSSTGFAFLPTRTLRPGEVFEEPLRLQGADVFEDPVRAYASAHVFVELVGSQKRELQTNLVTWTTLRDDRATFKFGDLDNDDPLYLTFGQIDEPDEPQQQQWRGGTAKREAEFVSEGLAQFDEATPLKNLELPNDVAVTNAYPLVENPHGIGGIRQVIASSGSQTARLHGVESSAPYARSYDEAFNGGYQDKYLPPPIRFEIASDRTMIETVATAPRLLTRRLGLDANDLSYTHATERARRIAALLGTTLHAAALVEPFAPAPRGQTIALAMTVDGVVDVANRPARQKFRWNSSHPSDDSAPGSESDYGRIDVPGETTRVSGEARTTVSAPADGVFVRISYTADTNNGALSAGAIARLERILNATAHVQRYRLDQGTSTHPILLTMALDTTDLKRIEVAASAVASPRPDLPAPHFEVWHFFNDCAGLDDKAIAAALAVARANAEHAAVHRVLRKLVLAYVGPPSFDGGSCDKPLPPAGVSFTRGDQLQITVQVPVRLVYRTFAP